MSPGSVYFPPCHTRWSIDPRPTVGFCEGVEGTSLPTDCPGEKLTSAQVSGVHFKTLDYRDGRWDDPAVFDWPAAMPTASNFGGPSIVVTGDDGSTTVSGSGGSRHITTIIPSEPVDEPEEMAAHHR